MNGDQSCMPSEGRSGSRCLVIGEPDSRRVTDFVRAATGVLAGPPRVLSYRQALAADAWDGLTTGDFVRLESPGACPDATKLFLIAGIPEMERQGKTPFSRAEVDSLQPERGEILHPLQWYLGFRAVLGQLSESGQRAGVDWLSTPAAVVTAFDKLACRELWTSRGLPLPAGHPAVSRYDELRREIRGDQRRLFIKLRFGYSAIGAVALEWSGQKIRALTTVQTEWSGGRPRLFLSRQPRTLLREFEIAWLIDTLAQEGMIVEDWLPKARWQGVTYDLRVVTIGGDPRHVVGRASPGPFTNLNLGARRMSAEVVEEQLGESWPACLELCREAAAALPDAGMLGIDVLVSPCRNRFHLLEANAFGDYLPGLLHRGENTAQAQLRCWLSAGRKELLT